MPAENTTTPTTPEPFELERKVGTVPSWTNAGNPTRADLVVALKWTGKRFSMQGHTQRPRAYDIDSGGQIVEELRNPELEPAPGYTRESLAELAELWDRWHLNDMQSACEHQRALEWTYDEHRGEDCPVCGYRIGSAWLTEEVPAEAVARAVELLEGTAGTPAPPSDDGSQMPGGRPVELEIIKGPELTTDAQGWEYYAYRLRLTRDGRQMTTPWRQGLALEDPPEAKQVLGSMLSECASFDNAGGLEEWAGMHGMEPEEAAPIYRETERQAKRVRAFLGDDYETAIEEA